MLQCNLKPDIMQRNQLHSNSDSYSTGCYFAINLLQVFMFCCRYSIQFCSSTWQTHPENHIYKCLLATNGSLEPLTFFDNDLTTSTVPKETPNVKYKRKNVCVRTTILLSFYVWTDPYLFAKLRFNTLIFFTFI